MSFQVGEQVRVREQVTVGNPRTPRYLRGQVGRVVRSWGIVVNPLDHHQPYPPLYSVVFPLARDRGGRDEVVADLHAEWLEPVPTRHVDR